MASRALNGLRVLLLEDELLIALEVEQICQDEGCEQVLTFRDLAEMNDRLATIPEVDLAIIDVVVGSGTTLHFANELRQRKIPFVFATGLSANEEVFGEFSGVPVVTKPYASEKLVQALRTAIAQKAD